MNNFIELFGERIDLIYLNKKYLNDINEYSLIPEFYNFLEYRPFLNINETKVFFKKLVSRSDGINCHYWMIYNKKLKKVIGTIGLHDIDWRKGSAELTYGLSPLYWGKGFFSESLNLVVDWFFCLENSNRICLKTASSNIGSVRAVTNFGFKEEGRLRNFYLDEKTNFRWDAIIFSLLKSEYSK